MKSPYFIQIIDVFYVILIKSRLLDGLFKSDLCLIMNKKGGVTYDPSIVCMHR